MKQKKRERELDEKKKNWMKKKRKMIEKYQ